MAYIGNSPYPSGNFSATTHNGGTDVFTMGQSPGTKNAVLVFIDGVRQDPLNYEISGATLTLGTAAPAGVNNVQILVSGNELGLNVPADDSIAVDALNTTSAGTTGQFLQKSGASTIDWSTVPDEVATQTGQAGKYLTTDGATTSWGTVAATDVTGLQNDIATLALHSAIQNNQSAYNLSNAFIDQYENNDGIDTTSTVTRDAASEYMASGSVGAGGAAFVSDANTMVLLHMDGANDGTVFTDDSSPAYTVTPNANMKTVTGVKKIGTASAYFASGGSGTNNGDFLSVAGQSVFNRTGDFTLEGWLISTHTTHCALNDFRSPGNASNFYMDWQYGGSSNKIAIIFGAGSFTRVFSCPSMADGNWHHWATVRDSSDSWYFYFDGTLVAPDSGSMTTELSTDNDAGNEDLSIGTNESHDAAANFIGHMDEFRFSDNVRYPSGTTFIPNAGVITSATGNYTSTNQTSAATVSKMGLVLLYKDEEGTATLDTDLVAQVSADGGSNYTSAPLTNGGTFSTGIKIAKSNDITISNTGSAPKYKVSFANQAAGSKVTRVYGAALLY